MPPLGATGFEVPAASCPSIYRSRPPTRVPNWRELHQLWEGLSGAWRPLWSKVRVHLRPRAEIGHREYDLDSRRRVLDLRLRLCLSVLQKIETPTDRHEEPSHRRGKRCCPDRAAVSEA